MSLPRYAAKRDISEPEIVTVLEQVGMTVVRMDQPVDLLVGYRGKNYLVECKTRRKRGGGEKKTDPQAKFIEEWRGQTVVLFDAQEAMDWAVSVAEGSSGHWEPIGKAAAQIISEIPNRQAAE